MLEQEKYDFFYKTKKEKKANKYSILITSIALLSFVTGLFCYTQQNAVFAQYIPNAEDKQLIEQSEHLIESINVTALNKEKPITLLNFSENKGYINKIKYKDNHEIKEVYLPILVKIGDTKQKKNAVLEFTKENNKYWLSNFVID